MSSTWLYQPHTFTDSLMAIGMSVAAFWVFVVTMPRRHPTECLLREAVLTVVDADPDPDGGTRSDTYELRVHDVSVLVRLREQWAGRPLVPYVHIEHEANGPRLLLVEVDNQGESEYR
ncbi:hypothetical protein [Embleya sp. MST-111070]|uniref:hypothetical protein n=1 Tax=Embleya sp. MST-111070 TaxID=3398231 RepID=UPI003F733148